MYHQYFGAEFTSTLRSKRINKQSSKISSVIWENKFIRTEMKTRKYKFVVRTVLTYTSDTETQE